MTSQILQHRISGLYAITPEIPDTAELLRKVRSVLSGGARVLQYRDKHSDAALKLSRALALRKLTQEFHATLIINDDVRLAARVDADGVHLGITDDDIGTARNALGANKIVGVSCYNQLSRAHDAAAAGADYVAFGAFFSSAIKPEAAKADIGLLHQARAELDLPLVAIGGITPQNGTALVQAGADALAVISSVFNAADITVAARTFSTLFIQDQAP